MAKTGRPRKSATTTPATETVDVASVQQVGRAECHIVGMRVLCEPCERYYVGRQSVTGFPECRQSTVTDIRVMASVVRVHYGNGWHEDFDTAAVSLLWRPIMEKQ